VRSYLEINVGIPIGTMKELTLEGLDAVDIRPSPLIQYAFACNKHIGGVFILETCRQVFELDKPLIGGLTPSSTSALLLEPHVLPDIVFCGNVFPVLEDLRRRGKEGRPSWGRLGGQLVCVCGNI
jgi:hypothetical protein